jgi:hypothetical protein
MEYLALIAAAAAAAAAIKAKELVLKPIPVRKK